MLNKIKDYFYFKTLVAPTVIQAIHFLFIVSILVTGSIMLVHGNFFRGAWVIIFGALTVRLICELMILLFKINNTITEINNKLKTNCLL